MQTVESDFSQVSMLTAMWLYSPSTILLRDSIWVNDVCANLQ